jgi:hypothetical protein
VIDQRRFAQREPRSLEVEQLGDMPVTLPIAPHKVRASVLWEDGVEELVDGVAIAWTRRAVRVRFGIPGHVHDVWVWVGAVEGLTCPCRRAAQSAGNAGTRWLTDEFLWKLSQTHDIVGQPTHPSLR